MFRKKNIAMLAIGFLIGFLSFFMMRFFTHRTIYPPGTWMERAKTIEMSYGREFYLPLNNPEMVSVQQASHMRDEDLVIGVLIQGKERAYPWWVVANYHVINDTFGKNIPLYVGFCERCSGAGAFDPRLSEISKYPLSFQVSGLHEGTFKIIDYQTLSEWHPFTGVCVSGSLKGRKLKNYPVVIISWKEWMEQYPKSVVAYAGENLRKKEHGQLTPQVLGHETFLEQAMPKFTDKRLPGNELIYGLLSETKRAGFAIPIKDIKGKKSLSFSYENKEFVLLFFNENYTIVFENLFNGKRLEIKSHSNRKEFEDQYGNIWNIQGKCIQGPDKDAELKVARGYLTEWNEWLAHFPKSTLYKAE